MQFLAILLGSIIGFSLGLTGGGGGVLAVPMLVYGLDMSPNEAITVSLAAVGGTALFGTVPRVLHGAVDLPTGFIFAISGSLGAPLGAYSSTYFPEKLLLLLFAVIMAVIAQRMWSNSHAPSLGHECPIRADQPMCIRTETGQLKLTSKCAGLLSLIGLSTGFLSGLLGVGGGFIIVPALVLVGRMTIHRAVGTSLFVIALVSGSALASRLLQDMQLPPASTFLFIVGGLAGMLLGSRLSRHLAGPALQKVFAATVLVVASFILFKQVSGI